MYTFIETYAFTALAQKLINQEEHDELTAWLINHPESGDLIPGGGGIRKLRIALRGTGKSGGARVIYFFINHLGQIYLLLIYPKSKKENIDDKTKAALKQLAKEIQNDPINQ